MRSLFVLVSLLAGLAHAADAPVIFRANELTWTAVATPNGAQQAALWTGATFARWPYSTQAPSATLTRDLHIVVLAGTVTFDIDGQHKEIGPGGVATIPKGVAHVLGCESSGDCTFLMQLQ